MDKRQAVEFLEYLRQDRNLEGTIYVDALNMAIEALKAQLSKEGATSELSTIQPEPHEGEWINTNPEYKNGFYNNSYYCSECHDYYTTSPYEMKFCPNCGAKMTISTK